LNLEFPNKDIAPLVAGILNSVSDCLIIKRYVVEDYVVKKKSLANPYTRFANFGGEKTIHPFWRILIFPIDIIPPKQKNLMIAI